MTGKKQFAVRSEICIMKKLAVNTQTNKQNKTNYLFSQNAKYYNMKSWTL